MSKGRIGLCRGSDGVAGTFPTRDIKKILRGKESAKALRAYYDENF
jgi:hypothetical protein